MKSIKDLRESYDLIIEKEEHDMNKLTQLVRAGLFDAKKLSALKRAMDKPADKMTAQEKRMMINLLDALMAEVLSDKQVYRKIKQDVMREAADWENREHLSGPDPKVKRFGYPSQKDVPTVLLLKRKSIRVFPDGQKVALYYAQAIDKYISIPYNEIGINEEAQLDEFVGPLVRAAAGAAVKQGIKLGRRLLGQADDAVKATGKAKPKVPRAKPTKPKPTKPKGKNPPKGKGGKGGRVGTAAAAAAGAAAGSGGGSSGGSGGGSEPKYFTPMSSKLQANITKPERTSSSDSRSERERQANLRASKSMANESVELDGNLFQLNNEVAPKVKSLYESLNKVNKKKMIGMMNESAESLEKVISFAVRQ